MYNPSYISSRIVLYISSKSLPIPQLLSNSTIPTCERAMLSNFVTQGLKFSYLSPPYPTLTRSPFTRASKTSKLRQGVYTTLPPYNITVKYAMQTLMRTYGNNLGGATKPLLIITGHDGAPVARLLSSLMSGAFPKSIKNIPDLPNLPSLETTVDLLLPHENEDGGNNVVSTSPGIEYDWYGYFNEGVVELGGDAKEECEVITSTRQTSPISVFINSKPVKPLNPPTPRNDFLSSACVNTLSQSVYLMQSEFDSIDVQSIFHNGKTTHEIDKECKEMCEGIWKEWECSRAI
eukprot:CAMPEP_0118660266 /NCGR_PEP_ID=MMETSP0785-20121206/15578_1 /TAXON_ID=91992 /ORGANISM="Bolidomonas pacifica, Strain CCMP 1866" /LENGTH=290 /DNA_ID=CAMNT_0006553475 /DNA_START=151 /DNA_END=1020 /DNA_ORIENTATION=+